MLKPPTRISYLRQDVTQMILGPPQVAKGLGAAADRASQAREVFAERGKARLGR